MLLLKQVGRQEPDLDGDVGRRALLVGIKRQLQLLRGPEQLIHLLGVGHPVDEVQRVHHLARHAVIWMDQDVR